MLKLLKILALAFMFSFSSTVFAEPPDDVGTGKPCPECATITTTSPDGADATVPDDVGTGSGKTTLAAWWELLSREFQKY